MISSSYYYYFYYFKKKKKTSYNGYFVDLYVRKSNLVGVQMYEKMGYVIYRRVLGYYAAGDGDEEEDALGKFCFCLFLSLCEIIFPF